MALIARKVWLSSRKIDAVPPLDAVSVCERGVQCTQLFVLVTHVVEGSEGITAQS